ncbi:TPA: hypothetical protein PPD39_002773 [Acinetobacter baumannii]|mgnify:CR=1 FL=1|uniref:hypothetical protein n=1 Tax=Acinetobacter TaxID=469 RepID=UPI000DE787CA|nr:MULTISPECIES: hypothetical protein [Acinetobacter]HAV4234120.1 hypothetical protein [Acinetobacter baumannii ATCC 17978]MBR7714443.1 hypothetical protein [Acinetobacter nosocomialis]MBR7738205.1 hypothetical protein [Acinetobacter nosocomialis]MCA4384375.1 hypothetical protein [Acinetobacter baumannii]MCJ9372497.1 hypothetical protein [Acinetobacter baumannii]
MFVQHDEYLINTSNINFIKLNEKVLKVYVYFGPTGEGNGGGMISLSCEDEAEYEELIAKLTK